jgi:hypothetical protein
MYIINKSDGTIAATVNEGVINTTDTDLVLVGKNYLVYGEIINENFVRLLENFANDTAPTKPIKGQLWYNTNNDKLLVYDETSFKPINPVNVAAATPDTAEIGDLWYDSTNQQLKFWNGGDWIVVAPLFAAGQSKSGIFVETINDNFGAAKVVTSLWNNNIRIIIFSNNQFIPGNAIAGFTTIKKGINIYDEGLFNGTAENALLLDNKAATEFYILDNDATTTGNLTIENDDALTLGVNNNILIGVDNDGAIFESLINNQDVYIKVKDNTGSTLTPFIVNGDGLVQINTELYVETFTANSTFTVDGLSYFTDDVDISANLAADNISVVATGDFQNVIVGANTTSNVFVGNVANIGNTKTVTLQVNDTRTSADFNINGNIELHNNKISFVDNLNNNSYVRGEAGHLYFGTQGNDQAYIRPDGIAVFNNTIQGPICNFDVIQSGNFSVINNVLTNTQTNGDVTINGSGTGQVRVNKLASDTSLTANSLIVSGGSVNAFDCTGSAIISGSLTISGNINIAGATNFTSNVSGGNISMTTVTATNISGTLTTAAQPNITSVGTLTTLNVSGTAFSGAVQTGNIAANNVTASNNINASTFSGTSISVGSIAVSGTSTFTGVSTFDNNLTVNGELRCVNDIVAFFSSDARLKTNISTLENTLDKLETVKGVSFNWNQLAQDNGKDNTKQIGIIAQDLETVFPELVHTKDDGYKTVDYIKLTAVLLQAVNELRQEIKNFKS